MNPPEPPLHKMTPLLITIEDKLAELGELLKRGKPFRFKQILRQARSRTEIIVTFLAVLELIKQRQVQVVQSKPFEDILIEPLAAPQGEAGEA